MFFRRALIPIAMVLTLLVQFLPGTAFAPRPVAAAACDWAQFIADVSIPDGTSLAPGATFVKTWRLKNIGTCTWTTSYSVVFTGGDQMGASAVVNLTSSVAPGATVDISVNMTAPSALGHYRGNWKLRNASGGLFGVGASANYLFWVDINVNTSYTGVYDFVANYCSAAWTSGAGALSCPGTDGDAKGFVLKVDSPQLENGSVDSNPGLVVNPQKVTGGYIQAVYPAITVQAGDHFQSIINCAYNAPNCYVNFRLNYQIGSGPVNTFWSFNERSEGLFYRVNLDLSSLAGQSVNFILYVADVSGHGSPAGDRAEWVETKISRAGSGPTTPIPPPTTCDKGAFVGDVTVPDGTVLAPGQSFTKTWRVRNIGSCTWTTDYALVYVFGYQLGVSQVVNLPSSVAPVAPGATADFSVNMVAPSVTGHYRSYWRFRNAAGAQFGVGSGMITFFADIYVSTTAPTSTTGPTATTGPTPTSTTVPTATPTSAIPGPNADLSITVNDGLMTYIPGGAATYTVVVSNGGPSNVTGAVVTVTEPVQITSWTVTCVPDSGAVCTAGPTTPPGNITDLVNIPVGKKVTYTIVSSISASAVGNLVTTATVTSPGPTPDSNMANNSATDTDAPPSADLSVTITNGISVWIPGGSTTYTVVVTNNGPLNVTGAVFNDNKPAQVTGWSWTCTPDAGATCGAGSGGAVATGIADTANIPAGKKVTYTIIASLGTAIPGNLVNTVTITAPVGTPDPVPANNTATDTDTGPTADLAVTKTDGVTYYTPSGTLTYTIRVVNNGPQPVIGATFADNIPTQMFSWTWTCVPDFSSTCTSPGASSTANFTDTINVPVGQGVTYTVVATVGGGATGNLVNTASVTAPGAIPDPVLANNTATDNDTAPTADLSVTMTDGLTVYPPGGTVTYTIVVTNNGPTQVTGANVTDTFPAEITSLIWTCAADSGATCTPGPGSGNINDLVNIPVGKKVTYTVVASVSAGVVGPMTNSVTVTAPGAVPDPIPGNNTATDTDVHPSADLAVTMTDMVTTYVPGGTVIYTIIVTNNGPSDITGATFSDTAPAQWINWTWNCAPELGAVCRTVPVSGLAAYTDTVNIPVGKRLLYTVVAIINLGAVGSMSNTASIALPGSFPPDPVPGNNTATDIDTP